MPAKKTVTQADVRASQMRIVQALIAYGALQPVHNIEHADVARILDLFETRRFLFIRQEDGRAHGDAMGSIAGVSSNLNPGLRIGVSGVEFEYLIPELRPARKARPRGPQKWTGLWLAAGRHGNHLGFLVVLK